MSEPIYVFLSFAAGFLGLLSTAMIFRIIFSMFFEGGGFLINLAYALTEPAILPMRKLFDKLGLFEESPIDIASGMSYLVIILLRYLVEFSLAS